MENRVIIRPPLLHYYYVLLRHYYTGFCYLIITHYYLFQYPELADWDAVSRRRFGDKGPLWGGVWVAMWQRGAALWRIVGCVAPVWNGTPKACKRAHQ